MSSDAKLPGGLAQIYSQYAKEDESKTVATTCLLTSQSVSAEKRKEIMEQLVGEQGEAESGTIVGASSGLIVLQDASDILAMSATRGSIVFAPDAVDVKRGEGLFSGLAPALEAVLSLEEDEASQLVVIVPAGLSSDEIRAGLQAAVTPLLTSLVSKKGKTIRSLEDIITNITYVASPQDAAAEVLSFQTVPVSDASARLATLRASGLSAESRLSPVELAAARALGPATRGAVEQVVESVKQVCRKDNGEPQLVVNFGQLCDTAVKQAVENWNNAAPASLISNRVAQSFRESLVTSVERELQVLLLEQLQELHAAQWDQFKKGISKLVISPALQKDMNDKAKEAIQAFNKSVKGVKSSSAIAGAAVGAAKARFSRLVGQHIRQRLLKARSSGQFKPVPRKGVTLGFHWLLPKPFGNDYRQEPWMVHATEGMVYVPQHKVTEVDPSEDWRQKIVPSPVGNDMVFLP